MLAEDLLKQGDIKGALASLQDKVRSDPADATARVFLFQLLAVMGDWDRALTQLNVAGDLDSATLPMVQAYREALNCEVFREGVFAGARSPLVFGDPERWIALALESVRVGANGQAAEALALRDEAFEDAPVTPGKIDGEPFEWIADGDSRIGPFLEAVVNGRYYWVPFERIARLEIEQPSDLRDFVWAPSLITWTNGGEVVCFIPSRYPETVKSGDDAAILCRRTNWLEQSNGDYFGVGQRVLATDANEYSLLDIRLIEFDVEIVEAEESADPAPGAE